MWALAKIKAYQSIKEPFIHVDGDVFIWTKIDESLRDHELIVQNEETTTDYYGKMWRDIRHAISYMPEEMKRYDLHIDNKAIIWAFLEVQILILFSDIPIRHLIL